MADVLAWHWIAESRALQFAHDGQEGVIVEVGQTLTVSTARRSLSLCHYGLHASVRALDALRYAPGPIVCRVRLSGEILRPAREDKLCASERTVLAMADATTVLHEFACWAAEEALLREREQGREPDDRSWAAIEAKRAWLRGEITDDQLAAAWGAAWGVARAAPWAAPWAAARSVAWGVAGAAPWAAAAHVAWAAAGGVAGAAPWGEMNAELERRLMALLDAADIPAI